MAGAALLVLGLLVTALGSSMAAPAPLTHVAGPLVLHHAPGYESVAETLGIRGNQALPRIARDLGLSIPTRVDIWLVPRKGGVQPADWGLPSGPSWAAGLALHGQPLIVLRTDDAPGSDGSDPARVLAHELVHVVVSQGLGDRVGAVPAWLSEGVASFEAYEWRIVDGAAAIRLALAGRWLELGALSQSFPDDGEDARLAYLESFSFIDFLVAERPDGLRVLFPALARGDSFPEAFRAAFGMSLHDAEIGFRKSYQRRFRWVPIITSSTTLWLVVTSLVVAGWARKRRRAENVLAAWEVEEAREDALSLEQGGEHGQLPEQEDPADPLVPRGGP